MKDKQKGFGLIAYVKQKKIPVPAAAVILAFGMVCALPRMIALPGEKLAFTNSIWSFVVFLALTWFFRKILEKGFCGKKSDWVYPGILGFAFSFCMVAGTDLELYESVSFQSPGMWIAMMVGGIAVTVMTRYGFDRLSDLKRKRASKSMEKASMQLRSFLLRAGIIFICYIPVFLAVYPGFFVYDAQDEYMQVVTRNFTTHHPMVHVLLLGGMIQLFYKITGDYNVGIACYTLLQMIMLSGIFSFCVEKLKERGLKRGGQILLTLYFGLCPVIVMFSLCSAKDGLFTGMLLVMVLLLQELFRCPQAFFEKKGFMILFVMASLGMMLLRHNGLYAFLVFIPVAVFFLKNQRKKVTCIFLVTVVLYFVISRGITLFFHADDSENQEMLTVPIMQMVRVYHTDENLSEAEKEVLQRYLPQEAIARYNPKVSDGVKIAFDNQAFMADKASFLKLWMKWGAEHPFTYMNAWFMTSYGFWYPDTVIDVYRGNQVFTYTYEDSSYFGYEVEQPGSRESKIPWLDELYRKMSLTVFQQKVPALSILFSPGALFWMMLFLMGFLFYAKEIKRAVPFLLPFLVWLTVILGPTYLVRYVVFLWFVVPLLIWEVIFMKFDNSGQL